MYDAIEYNCPHCNEKIHVNFIREPDEPVSIANEVHDRYIVCPACDNQYYINVELQRRDQIKDERQKYSVRLSASGAGYVFSKDD